MSTSAVPATQTARVAALFDQKPPVLVEVRFPNMGTSPDWYLCHDEDELEPILERVGAGVEVRLSSVHDVADPTGGVVIRKPA